LALTMADNVKAREQDESGNYHYVTKGKQACESQILIQLYTNGKLKVKPSFEHPLEQKWTPVERAEEKITFDPTAAKK